MEKKNLSPVLVSSSSTSTTTTINNHHQPPNINGKSLEIVDNVDNKKKPYRRDQNDEAVKNLKEMIPDIEAIFDIRGRIGNGTFSTVFLGSLKSEKLVPEEKKKLFAIKHLIPTSHPKRIVKELKCLVEIGGADNVAGVNFCLRCHESVAFVIPYIPHDRFQDFYDNMKLTEIVDYMRNLLIALRRVHSFQVIHRDIKPSNFLYNRKKHEFMLVDFGLAQTVIKPETLTNSNILDNNSLKRKLSGFIGGDDDDNDDSPIQNDVKKYCLNTPAEIHEQQQPITVNLTESIPVKSEHIASDDMAAIINSPFKMPLKQVNGVLMPKSVLKNDPPLCRNLKSAILGVTMTNRLQEKVRNKPNFPSQSSATTTSPAANYPNPITPAVAAASKYNTNRPPTVPPPKCYCYGKPQVCNICLIQKEIPASRAGTPGYRPPEVLLKYTDQNCAVDMWAVGVIFISILSGMYPFFKAPDDFVALAEIVMLFGDESIRRTAKALKRQVTISQKCKPLDLRKLCVRLKNRTKIDRTELLAKYQVFGKICEECSNCQQKYYDCLCANTKYVTESIGEDHFPTSAYDLLTKLLEVNPFNRITADAALQHPFFQNN